MADSRRTIVITGASAGVGRATAREFAKEKARIGLIARGIDGLEAAKREVQEAGGEAIIFPIDVADSQAVERAAAEVEKQFGPIDVWVNNAMLSVFSKVKDTTAEEYRRVTEVTYLGYVYGTLSALKRMLPRNRGQVIQVGSALAYRSIPLQSAYCAAKHAIMGFTESLWTELLHDKSNVDVTVVHLPAVNTTQFRWVKSRLPNKSQPVPPIFQPEVAADAIVWASHHPQPEVMLGWPTIKAIYADKIVPRLADRYLARNGIKSQQTDEPYEDRPHNLWKPVPGDHGAHGVFGSRAKNISYEFWLRKNIGALASIGIVAAAALLFSNLSKPKLLLSEQSS